MSSIRSSSIFATFDLEIVAFKKYGAAYYYIVNDTTYNVVYEIESRDKLSLEEILQEIMYEFVHDEYESIANVRLSYNLTKSMKKFNALQ